jgi:hypothetical protein
MYYSDDPVADFNRWDADMEDRRLRNRRGRCAHCGEDIEGYEDYYDFDGELIHDDCLYAWADKFKKEY